MCIWILGIPEKHNNFNDWTHKTKHKQIQTPLNMSALLFALDILVRGGELSRLKYSLSTSIGLNMTHILVSR
jgi:hypothetical protein